MKYSISQLECILIFIIIQCPGSGQIFRDIDMYTAAVVVLEVV